MRPILTLTATLLLSLPRPSLRAATFDEAAKPGANYDKAEFRLWLPENAGPVRALVVLVPGSNGDGRAMVDDAFWQEFAAKNKVGLVACRFTDKPHDQGFIEEYVDVSKGSGQALVDSIAALGEKSGHKELATAPLMFWGMSAGGEYNYEFAVWKPDRVIAFIVNKGNIYYTALAPLATRRIPALLFTGEKDLDFRINTINGIFAVNRRGGALWALTQEPGIGHEVGRSKELGAMLFEDMMAARLPDNGAAGPLKPIKPIDEKSGFIADLTAKTYAPVGDTRAPNHTTAWLPTERLAKAWVSVVTGGK
jgi:poly(3-hydroxybutyrate) depolymerase